MAADPKGLLEETRAEFRRRLQRRAQASGWPLAHFPGRIAVVLSGGGARGAYEAGALLAFQDAAVPTHILAATSIGSVNAASYAAHSSTFVGNAESLVESWSQVTPPAMGIDWSRYILMLAGFVAATAGFFNALKNWLEQREIFLHGQHPILTWLALLLAGASIMLFYDQLPYIAYVIANLIRRGYWRPDRKKALISAFANLLVIGFVYMFLSFTHLHVAHNQVVEFEVSSKVLAVLLAILAVALWRVSRDRLSLLSHKFIRLPMRTGLFPNYERTKYLRSRIPADGLRNSPIRVVMTATDINDGNAKYFTNAPVSELARDPHAQAAFVASEIEQAEDLLQAVVASSAFTIAYEAVLMQGRLWTDGGIVTNQPIRPAVRLGADILFLVMVEPAAAHPIVKVETFLDVGVRAIDILIAKNLKADLKLLDRLNHFCETYAASLGLTAQEVQLEMSGQILKFIKPFTISPKVSLPGTALDFDGSITIPAILQGYRDSCEAIEEFLDYVATLPAVHARQRVKLSAELVSAAKA
jgi:predicted acylesterase/phospholipase RssA